MGSFRPVPTVVLLNRRRPLTAGKIGQTESDGSRSAMVGLHSDAQVWVLLIEKDVD
ncbi:hypothetical protein [Paenibacillus sp. 32O-W]|uniref:hypothetical protein n=1 Tax=Paenibacillus sp. 32O-W TaxID=1695218 RepID=UPI001C92F553|nr:hypothetical protein [Paenibacillus sp. 32O-W]